MDPRLAERSQVAPCLGGARADARQEEALPLAPLDALAPREPSAAPAAEPARGPEGRGEVSWSQRLAEEIGFVLVMLFFFALLSALIAALISYTVWRLQHLGA
jgi:hypothetical protein